MLFAIVKQCYEVELACPKAVACMQGLLTRLQLGRSCAAYIELPSNCFLRLQACMLVQASSACHRVWCQTLDRPCWIQATASLQ